MTLLDFLTKLTPAQIAQFLGKRDGTRLIYGTTKANPDRILGEAGLSFHAKRLDDLIAAAGYDLTITPTDKAVKKKTLRKAVVATDPETGEETPYPSMTAAANATGVTRQAIGSAIETGGKAGGYEWRVKK